MTPIGIPVALLTRAQRAADAFHRLTGVEVDAAEVLTGRAALLGLSAQGPLSAGGATRLMPSADGWCALTLSRQDDIDAVPALVGSDVHNRWSAVRQWVADNSAAAVTTYVQDDRAAETRCTTTPAKSPPAAQLGADNATVERLLAERHLASC